MAKLHAFQLPDRNIISVSTIHAVKIFKDGVGIFSTGNRMIGWIKTSCQEHSNRVSDLLFKVINSPYRSNTPDWGFLKEAAPAETEVAPAQPAPSVQPEPPKKDEMIPTDLFPETITKPLEPILDRIPYLPVVPQRDAVLRALARQPLPSVELARLALGSGDEGRFHRLWAIQVAADAHVQTPTGERFERIDAAAAHRYDSVFGAWFPSKNSAGGALKLTQTGFNPLMWGQGAQERYKGYFDTSFHLLTNDTRKNSGYRFIADGKKVLEYYAREARQFRVPELRSFFVANADRAADTRQAEHQPRPDHHRLLARVAYGWNRASGRGYLDINCRTDGRDSLASLLGAPDDGTDVCVRVTLAPGGWLVMSLDDRGWKLTDSGALQVSTLAAANVGTPSGGVNEVRHHKNLPVQAMEVPGTVGVFVGSMVKYANQNGDGRKTRAGSGSKVGRAKSLIPQPIVRIVEENRAEA